jgi:hypothetical protein
MLVALFTWFALSIPATLLVARMFGVASDDDSVPFLTDESPRSGRVSSLAG